MCISVYLSGYRMILNWERPWKCENQIWSWCNSVKLVPSMLYKALNLIKRHLAWYLKKYSIHLHYNGYPLCILEYKCLKKGNKTIIFGIGSKYIIRIVQWVVEIEFIFYLLGWDHGHKNMWLKKDLPSILIPSIY